MILINGLKVKCLIATKKVNKERIETVIYSCAQQAWNHQQNKIGCMQVDLDGANERAMMMFNHKNAMVDKMQAEIDELQKRIDGALKILDGMRHNGAHRAMDILKGNKDE